MQAFFEKIALFTQIVAHSATLGLYFGLKLTL